MFRLVMTCLFSLTVFLALENAASAQSATLLKSYNDYWQAYKGSNGGNKYCFAATIPTDSKATPAGIDRADTYFFITREPARNVYDEINIILGYQANEEAMVTVQIGSDKYQFVPKGDAAWAGQPAQEKQIVSAIKRGLEMVVTGTAANGTVIVDNYTLKGATATINHMARECP